MSACLDYHLDPNQYPWLSNVNGGIDYIEFEEPVESGIFQVFDNRVASLHCNPSLISHNPDELVESHVRSFINPSTRFARLIYHFNNGVVREPTVQDYQKESDWFRGNGISDVPLNSNNSECMTTDDCMVGLNCVLGDCI